MRLAFELQQVTEERDQVCSDQRVLALSRSQAIEDVANAQREYNKELKQQAQQLQRHYAQEVTALVAANEWEKSLANWGKRRLGRDFARAVQHETVVAINNWRQGPENAKQLAKLAKRSAKQRKRAANLMARCAARRSDGQVNMVISNRCERLRWP